MQTERCPSIPLYKFSLIIEALCPGSAAPRCTPEETDSRKQPEGHCVHEIPKNLQSSSPSFPTSSIELPKFSPQACPHRPLAYMKTKSSLFPRNPLNGFGFSLEDLLLTFYRLIDSLIMRFLFRLDFPQDWHTHDAWPRPD